MISIERSRRNTPACAISIGSHTFVISYSTVIAYHGPLGRVRSTNHWGPTTGRHMTEFGVRDYEENDAKLDEIITKFAGMVK